MRRDRFWTFLLSAALAAVIACASVSCIITGFGLQLNAGTGGLILFCLICGLLSAGFLSLKHGGWILAGLGLLTGVLCLQDILYGVEVLLNRQTTLYNAAYGWGIWSWSGKPLVGMPADGAVLSVAALIATAVSWVMCRKHKAVWALIPAILPLAACLVVTDTVPAETALFWLIFGGVLLILTQTVRRRSAADGNRLTAIFLIPCLLLSALLFWAAPREGYEANGNPLQNAILHWLEQLPFAPGHNGNGISDGVLKGEKVDLSEIDDREKDERIVMEVAGAKPGLLYLRGQSYDVYTGQAWKVADLQIKDLGWPERNGNYISPVKIRTREVHDQLYFPYYTDSSILRSSMIRGRLENTHGIKNYEYNQYGMLTGNSKLELKMEVQCLELPADTQKNAKKILEEVFQGQTLSYMKKAEAIGDYVRESARYSLKVDKMPESEDDLAIWFLEEGKSGYCVHFATAAVVLLRAAGIPARYVNGYVEYASAGVSTVITGDDAHAWVEYYAPSVGWKILEVTPSEGLPQRSERPDGPNPTEPTDPITPTDPSTTTRPQTRPNNDRPSSSAMEGTDRPSVTTKVPGDNGGQTPVSSRMPPWLLAIPGGLGGGVLLVWLQYFLRCRHRRNRMRKGSSKQQLLVRWQYVLRLSRLLKTLPPAQLLELAEKAAFSQHPVEDRERQQFDHWIRDAEREVRAKSFSLLYRLIWAIE